MKEHCLMPALAEQVVEIPCGRRPGDVRGITISDLSTFLAEAGRAVRSPHRIRFYQLLFITHGEGTHWVESEPFHYSRGTLFALEEGQVQAYDPNPEREGYVVLFAREYFYRYSTDLEWLFGLSLFNTCLAPSVVQLPPEECGHFLALLQCMKDELTATPDFAEDDILRNLLRALILRAERCKRAQDGGKAFLCSAQDHHLLIQFRTALETRYASCRGVRDYAAAVAVSPKKLNKITRTYLGRSAKQAIDERVVLEIKRLLMYSDFTMHEIAYATGFTDPANMTRLFKHYARLTPAQFRLSCR
jgi:AraC family transcriptional activator of pobA